jgi:DNA-binding LacI/PurR family transcriptional regulator
LAGIQEIADKAGVSAATVSRALRGLHHVNEKTRAKILDAAASLGHIIASKDIAPGRTNTVGVIAPYAARWYFTQAIAGVEQALREAGMDLLLYNFNRVGGREKIFQDLNLKERVDALIIISLPPTMDEFESLLSLDIPISAIGFRNPNINSISINDVQGAKDATEHLISLGHTRIGLISGAPLANLDFTVPRDRRTGFEAALSDAGIVCDPLYIVHADFTMATGETAMDELLSRSIRPTAVFCESDEMAYGAMRSLKRHGLKCPEDISIIGFDGHEMAEFADLTTIAQPVRTLGEMAALSVMEKINKPEAAVRELTLATTLVIRGSTRKL